jgi:YHS domain-containing protein
MKLARSLIAAFAVFSSVFAANMALAGTETNVSSGLTAKGPGLAVHGYDVVAYFTDGQPTRGRAKYSIVYEDATYRFANEEHLEAFEDNPEKYLPQYGGYCAYGVAVGAKFDGDPHLWRIVDGKLYLNLNEEVQATWQKRISRYIKKGDRNWPRIAGKTPEELS